ncbi:MAG: Alkyl hydroperoxide reductase/ Thiol specific antioxidant/ Mal allergen [Microgenomates bacterium 39_7]|nr:MAG: Alkyl hydroperoxide reductase/ Thiol specific antioxidant/ Mal allergen [Microgenomates bacterium 39_7]
MLKPNDPVPTDISLLDLNGEQVFLNDYLDNLLLIYFYPRDNTPGCTLEAKKFRDLNQKLKGKGVKVIGISKDSVKSHKKFHEKQQLNFELLSDPDHKLQEAFGVWQEKRMMGNTYWGTVRSTFLIDKKGKVINVWPRVNPQDHAQEVLDYVEKNLKK